MDTIEQMRESIAQEKYRIDARLVELKTANAQDQNVLDTFIERYRHAVQDGAGDKEIFELEEQREEAAKKIKQRKEIIEILTKEEGSKIRRLSAELADLHLKAIEEIEARAQVKFEQLQPIHEKLCAGIHELFDMQFELHNHKKEISKLHLDKAVADRIGIKPGFRFSDTSRKSAVTQFIKSLEVKSLKEYLNKKEAQRWDHSW